MSSSSTPIGYVIASACLLLTVVFVAFLYKSYDTQFFNQLLDNVKRFKAVYLLVDLAVKLVLGVLIVTLGKFLFGGVVVLLVFFVWCMIVMVKLKPYTRSEMLRLCLSFILSLFVQVIYVYQSLTSSQLTEESINLYLPFSVITLVFIIYGINLAFYIYSIKQIRCCELEIEWETIKE